MHEATEHSRTKASKNFRFLESLAAAPTGFGQLSVAPHEENRRAEFSMLLKELQANSETVSCNIERLIEDYNMRGCNGIVANCGHREIHVVVKVGLNGHTKLGVSAHSHRMTLIFVNWNSFKGRRDSVMLLSFSTRKK
jgi:hypothetical protein